MAELKTKPTRASVATFINSVDEPQRRADSRKVAAMMRKATGKRSKMWGMSIVGYGTYQYTNTAGVEFEWPITGFSPRKQALTIYIMTGFSHFDTLMQKLGNYKIGKSCLYIKRLSDIDEKVLQRLIDASVKRMRKTYKTK
jgi:hypothetical protein